MEGWRIMARGWLLVTGVLLIFPTMLAVSVAKGYPVGSLKESFLAMFRPSETWGPADVQERIAWTEYMEEEGGKTGNNPFSCCTKKMKKSGTVETMLETIENEPN